MIQYGPVEDDLLIYDAYQIFNCARLTGLPVSLAGRVRTHSSLHLIGDDDLDIMLDYSKPQDERVRRVADIITAGRNYNGANGLSKMADYMLLVNDTNSTKVERASNYPIETRNRRMTIDKRQTSLDALSESLESSPLSIYDMMNVDRDVFLDASDTLTDSRIMRSDELLACKNVIDSLASQMEGASGKRKYALKRQIIETWQQMYVIAASDNRSRCVSHALDMSRMRLDGKVWFDSDMNPVSDCIISLFNPAHVSFLLEYYTQLRDECRDDLNSDMHHLLLDFDSLFMSVFPRDSETRTIVLLKMLGYSSSEIEGHINRRYGTSHTRQFYSMLWRNRAPRMLADEAARRYVWWYWSQPQNGMTWKRCNKCGRMKPAHKYFFRRNSSLGGFYSICKECNNSAK